MNKFEKKELKKKSENLSDWYNDIVLKAKLADHGPAKGTMVIRPYGFAIWERVQEVFNDMIKQYGVENAYFPLFIPHSLLEKEKSHIEGFSPELAVVTHGGGKKLAEPLVVRPTSETVMYEMYAKWIQSWRDLPMKINQWNNVVRWEMRTYLFLRTTEFLWQEGHTAHSTESEAIEMQTNALEWYRQIYEDYYAIPVIIGKKSESERFAGANTTFAAEALMPDGKALQGATSHNLGQNFSKSFGISFQTKDSKVDFVWQTSWGLSTRSLGGLFMVHGDDNGLILPPRIAPVKVVILTIFGKDSQKDKKVLEFAEKVQKAIIDAEDSQQFKGRIEIRGKQDGEEAQSFGRRINQAELEGIPITISIGYREVKSGTVMLKPRAQEVDAVNTSIDQVGDQTEALLHEIQKKLFLQQKKFLVDNIHTVDSYDEFKKIMSTTRGFIRALWCESADCEVKIKEETKVTTRCFPLDAKKEKGKCIYCGEPATNRWYFAQAY